MATAAAGAVTRFGIGGGIWYPLDASLFDNKEEFVPPVVIDPVPSGNRRKLSFTANNRSLSFTRTNRKMKIS